MADPITIFDRALLRKRRARAQPGFDGYDFLVREAAWRLADRLDDVASRHFPVALDLGCHTGQLTGLLAGRAGQELLVAADLSPAMARAAARDHPALAADEEWLPFAPASFDLVMSCLSLHWVNDLPGALAQIRRALKPDGLFLAVMLGGDTLTELRRSLGEAEIALEGGMSPRVAPFAEVADLGRLLQRAGFALPVADGDEIVVRYADPLRLLDDLRGMGASNPLAERRKIPLRRATLMAAMERYRALFAGTDGRCPATFQLVTLTGWAPHPSQPQPLAPGSATQSLADALGDPESGGGEA